MKCRIKGCKGHGDPRLKLADMLFCEEHFRQIVDDATTTNRVYYGERKDGLIKIGYSNDVRKRAEELDIYILATEPGGAAHERTAHLMFSEMRVGGSEWFVPDIRLIKHIKRLKELQGTRERKRAWSNAYEGKVKELYSA